MSEAEAVKKKKKKKTVTVLFQCIFCGAVIGSVIILLQLGTLRSNDANGNDNVQKNNWFYKQNDNFARASHVFYGERKQATTKIYLSFRGWIMVT